MTTQTALAITCDDEASDTERTAAELAAAVTALFAIASTLSDIRARETYTPLKYEALDLWAKARALANRVEAYAAKTAARDAQIDIIGTVSK